MKLSTSPLVEGQFVKRPNRFIGEVMIAGQMTKVHIPNTGRMAELLVPGASVKLSYCPNPGRKTDYTLMMVHYHDVWVVIHSTIANALVLEYYQSIAGISELKREVTFDKSRFDLSYRRDSQLFFCEIKSVNLVVKGTALFPDAPTERGKKHLRELMKAKRQGYGAETFFVVQRSDAFQFSANAATDPEFAETLAEARGAGVIVRAFKCVIGDDDMHIDHELPVCF